MTRTPSPSTSRAMSPRAARAGAVVLLLGGAFGCTPYSTMKTVPVDCSVENNYEILSIDTFEGETNPPFFASADDTPGAVMTATVGTPPDGARCGNLSAMEVAASGNDDWGSLIGYNNFGPRDASAYDGLSFWARAYGNSNKAFTLLLDDPNTYNPNSTAMPPTFNCTPAPMADAGANGTTVIIIDPATGAVLSSGTATGPPPANSCGNSYQAVVEVTSAWQFYTIPFTRFHQIGNPNRVPNAELSTVGNVPGTGLITSSLKTFTLRLPKAVASFLWLDNLGFYRPKALGDGGSDGQ